METIQIYKKPTKGDRKIAHSSYTALIESYIHLKGSKVEIGIEETHEKIILPVSALKLLGEILKAMSEGAPVSVVPLSSEVTTQKAAEILGCSRPFLIKQLEEGKIEYRKVGKHRRIRFEDVINFREKMKAAQKKNIIDMMSADEENGLYDT
jgi:excisionase family DNA binding protein